MVPSQHPPRAAVPSTSSGGRALAWARLLLALVFPLTYLLVVGWVLVRNLVPSGTNPFVGSLYTVFDYVEWPFPILAVILGQIGLARGGPSRPMAVVGLVLGYLSILALVGTFLALAVSSAVYAH
jgi:hypothetical protein